jgi:hypothetical protein
MSETPTGGGEQSALGGSSVLGVNNLQRAIDTFDRTVERLSGLISQAAAARSQYTSGQQTAGSWNKFSNWAGGSNGGGATFGGTPFNPNTSSGSTGASGGAHRAAGQPSYRSSSPYSGSHRGTGNGTGAASFALGMASSVGSSVKAVTGQTKDDSRRDSMTYLTTAQVMSTGQSVDAPRLFSYGGQYAFNATDQSSASMNIFQNAGGAPGSAAFSQMQRFTAQQGLNSPMMSASQASSAVTSLYSTRGYAGLRRVGITTIKPGGQRQSPISVANQILNQIDPQQTVNNPQDAAQLLSDPMSPLNMTLSAWVSAGMLSGDQVQAVKDNIQSILKARQHGVSATQLATLSAAAAKNPTGDAAKTLQGMHIGDSAMQREKDLGSAQRGRTIGGLTGFNEGLQASTKALTSFTNVINGFMNNTGLSHLSGLMSGGTMHGKLGGALALMGIPAVSPFGGEMMHLGGGLVSGAGSMIGSVTSHIPGMGGQNENRMSVNAVGSGAGGSGPSRGGHLAGGAGSGGGMRFVWPTNPHPLGEGFGAQGSHWSSGRHSGQDIEVGTGTPVHAAAAGVVNFSGSDGSYGYAIHVDHGNGIWTLYGHNSRLVARVGQKVAAGTLISYSGATGNVTGPHLHFEVRKGRDSYFNAVNPLPYLSGAASVPAGGSTTSDTGTTGGGPSTGSAGSTGDNGSGTSYTTSSGGSPGIGTTYGAGMSELDVLSSGGSAGGGGGGGGSMMTTTTSGGGGGTTTSVGGSVGLFGWDGTAVRDSHPGASGPSSGTPGPGTTGLSGNKAIVNKVARGYGWGSGGEWNSLVALVNSESGFRNTAQNPTSSAYGMFQFLDSTWHSYGGHKTSDPRLQSIYGLKYIKSRYGDPNHAWSFHKAHNWYDKGAWEIKADEDARVHKGEMILQKPAADQIRQILVNGNPYGAMGNQSKGSGQIILQFNDGSIRLSVGGGGTSAQTGRAIAKELVDTLAQDERIKALQTGTR